MLHKPKVPLPRPPQYDDGCMGPLITAVILILLLGFMISLAMAVSAK